MSGRELLRDLQEARQNGNGRQENTTGEVVSLRRLLPPPSAPLEVARRYVTDEHTHPEGFLLLRCYQDEFLRWHTSHWEPVEESGMRSRLYVYTEDAQYEADGESRPWTPTRTRIANVRDALGAACYLARETEQPVWLPGAGGQDGVIVACGNCLLNITTREQLAHSPNFFNFVSVPFDYDEHAPEPACWLGFIDSLEIDPAQVAALQEFFGYTVSGKTNLHKMALLIGPTRSGKGVISRTLTKLVGRQNVAGPTLSGLLDSFGLEPLIGKTLAVFADARLSGRGTHQVVERLLSISGEDLLTVNRKNRQMWTGKLTCRIVLCSNEMPELGDASAAIAGRFVTVLLTKGWLGQEDLELEDELDGELPGILNWALAGLARLEQNGWRFTRSEAAEQAFAELVRMASPVTTFVEETCEVDAEASVAVDSLWTAWKLWAERSGVAKGSKSQLGRNLHAAFPGLRVGRPRRDDGRERVYTGLRLHWIEERKS